MIYVGLPLESNTGWGILGKEVVLALSRLTSICLLPIPLPSQLKDEMDRFRIRQLLVAAEEHKRKAGRAWGQDAPVIQALLGGNLTAYVPEVIPSHVGFAVFEENVLPKASIDAARRNFRHFAAGSTYCADVLRQHGVNNVSVVLHGVDTRIFRPHDEPRPYFKNRFIVFSGGKFEYRKGQDIVIRAYKVLQDRHPDVMLVNAWPNIWRISRDTMATSNLIKYRLPGSGDHGCWMNQLLADNGIDVDRVISVGMRDHRLQAILYRDTDVGIFPNRVEGGTNLVLMEYLACGKPAIASYNSGHKDVLNNTNAILIEREKAVEIRTFSGTTSTWSEPDLEETIEKLEWAYQNRDQLNIVGRKAASDMQKLSWERVAQRLLEAVKQADKDSGSVSLDSKPQ